jgi:hypothetical protein
MCDDIQIIGEIFFDFDRAFYQHPIIRGTCPICENRAIFEQINYMTRSGIMGNMIPLICQGCNSIVIYAYDLKRMFPTPSLKGVEGLPEEIDKYYQEALRCMSAECPNGAVILFRKTVHAIGKYYKCEKSEVYDIIKELEIKGHITKKTKNALISIKDIGNDGAHINENEPDMAQAYLLKSLMDTVLKSSIVADQEIEMANTHHPNKHK